MNIIPYLIPLEHKDQLFLHLQEQIYLKRKMLLDKQKKIQIISKQNHFLNDVKHDYQNYYGHFIQQREDQIKALNLLKKYIHDLTISGNLSKQNIEDAKFEQKKIIRELQSIKNNLDSIIKNTDLVKEKLSEKNNLK